MPPSASWTRPRRPLLPAPVKAPGRWPKSSLSIRDSGMAAQLTATKRRAWRPLLSCSALAKISLPLPVSPVRRMPTEALTSRAARSIWRSSAGSPPDSAASGAGRGRPAWAACCSLAERKRELAGAGCGLHEQQPSASGHGQRALVRRLERHEAAQFVQARVEQALERLAQHRHGPGLGLEQPLRGAVVPDHPARGIQRQQVARIDVDELGRFVQPQDPVAPVALKEVGVFDQAGVHLHQLQRQVLAVLVLR